MSALHHPGMGKTEDAQAAAWPAFEGARPKAKAEAAPAIGERGRGSSRAAAEKESGAFHASLERAMTISFFPLFALALYLTLAPLAARGRLWLVALAVPLAMLAGDFVSGLVHWLADTYGTERTPLVGPNFIKWFRLHHVDQQDICRHGFVATNGNTCIFAAPLVALCLPFVWDEDVSAARAFSVLSVTLMAGATVATNQFHKWAHAAAPPPTARLLQRARLILDPRHHQRHHAEPFDANYCIANGWLNPLLDRVGFFRRLERALSKVGFKAAAG